MPLAFTQEDFLVIYLFATMEMPNILLDLTGRHVGETINTLCLYCRKNAQAAKEEMEGRLQIQQTEREALKLQVNSLKAVQQEKQQVCFLYFSIFQTLNVVQHIFNVFIFTVENLLWTVWNVLVFSMRSVSYQLIPRCWFWLFQISISIRFSLNLNKISSRRR